MKVFVSYRRDDAKHLAGRVADRLLQDDEIDAVFFDVETIRAGDDFVDTIDAALDRVAAFVVLIGERWHGPRDGEPARLHDEDDFVRREVARALEHEHVRVVPVLHGGASMPTRDDLPDELERLSRRNAVTLRHESFDRDVDHLADAITGRRSAGRRRALPAISAHLAGMVAAAALLVAAAVVHDLLSDGRSLDETLGTGFVWLLIGGTLAAGAWFGPRFSRRRGRSV